MTVVFKEYATKCYEVNDMVEDFFFQLGRQFTSIRKIGL